MRRRRGWQGRRGVGERTFGCDEGIDVKWEVGGEGVVKKCLRVYYKMAMNDRTRIDYLYRRING